VHSEWPDKMAFPALFPYFQVCLGRKIFAADRNSYFTLFPDKILTA